MNPAEDERRFNDWFEATWKELVGYPTPPHAVSFKNSLWLAIRERELGERVAATACRNAREEPREGGGGAGFQCNDGGPTSPEVQPRRLSDISREEWDALPPRVQRYIYELEAQADPAGTVREAFAQRENAAALSRLIEEGAHGLRVEHGHLVTTTGGQCVVCRPDQTPASNATMLAAVAHLLRQHGWSDGSGLGFLARVLEEHRALTTTKH